MIQFLLGHVLGSGRRSAGQAAVRLTVADLMVQMRGMFALACYAFITLLLLPLVAGSVYDVLVPRWSWKLRAGVTFGIL